MPRDYSHHVPRMLKLNSRQCYTESSCVRGVMDVSRVKEPRRYWITFFKDTSVIHCLSFHLSRGIYQLYRTSFIPESQSSNLLLTLGPFYLFSRRSPSFLHLQVLYLLLKRDLIHNPFREIGSSNCSRYLYISVSWELATFPLQHYSRSARYYIAYRSWGCLILTQSHSLRYASSIYAFSTFVLSLKVAL